MTAGYVTIGIVWLVVTVALAIYITGWRMKPEKHFRAGLRAMMISYFTGAIMLFIAVIRYS